MTTHSRAQASHEPRHRDMCSLPPARDFAPLLASPVHAESIRPDQSSHGSLNTSPLGSYGSAIQHCQASWKKWTFIHALLPANRPQNSTSAVESDVSTLRDQQRFPYARSWETKQRSKTGARSLREGLLRPLGRSHCAWLTCWCSSRGRALRGSRHIGRYLQRSP